MKRHRFLLACILSVTVANLLWAQQAVFEKVKVRFNRSEEDRRLVDKKADLILDESSQRLVVKSEHKPLDIAYDKVQKIVFDVSTHMRGGVLGDILADGSAGDHAAGQAGVGYREGRRGDVRSGNNLLVWIEITGAPGALRKVDHFEISYLYSGIAMPS